MHDSRVVPIHHPSEELLLEYASGAVSEPVALLVATHLALCPTCRRSLAELEAVGGALLDEAPSEQVADDSLPRLMARLDKPEAHETLATGPGPQDFGDGAVPQPLREYLGTTLDDLPWRRLGPVSEVRLLPDFAPITTRLLKIRPGTAMPSHTHGGQELTLVLKGGFVDGTGHYLRGDVAEVGSEVDHQPVADDDEICICLAVTDAPLRLTSRFGRMLNPFIRI
ncbi:MAG: ChrR family anti-sigma-E factor [Pseudomonadota bacterium]